jgi:hypothetical protein
LIENLSKAAAHKIAVAIDTELYQMALKLREQLVNLGVEVGHLKVVLHSSNRPTTRFRTERTCGHDPYQPPSKSSSILNHSVATVWLPQADWVSRARGEGVLRAHQPWGPFFFVPIRDQGCR